MASRSFRRPAARFRRIRASRDVESVKLRPDLIVRSSQTKGRPSGAPRRIGLNGLMAVTRRSTFSGRRSSTERRPASPPQLLRELLKLRQLDKALLDRQLQVLTDERAVDVLLQLLDEAVDLGRGERRWVVNGPHAPSLCRRATVRTTYHTTVSSSSLTIRRNVGTWPEERRRPALPITFDTLKMWTRRWTKSIP